MLHTHPSSLCTSAQEPHAHPQGPKTLTWSAHRTSQGSPAIAARERLSDHRGSTHGDCSCSHEPLRQTLETVGWEVAAEKSVSEGPRLLWGFPEQRFALGVPTMHLGNLEEEAERLVCPLGAAPSPWDQSQDTPFPPAPLLREAKNVLGGSQGISSPETEASWRPRNVQGSLGLGFATGTLGTPVGGNSGCKEEERGVTRLNLHSRGILEVQIIEGQGSEKA